jgi:hypothetical protein
MSWGIGGGGGGGGASTGWVRDAGAGTVRLFDETDRVGVGGAPGAGTKFYVVGDETRQGIHIQAGVGVGAAGGSINLFAGGTTGGGQGGQVTALGGDASGVNGVGGAVNFAAGQGSGGGAGGAVSLLGGAADATGRGGAVSLLAGDGGGVSGDGGELALTSGSATASGSGGLASLYAGDGAGNGSGGGAEVSAGSGAGGGAGGDLYLSSGNGGNTGGAGDVGITAGNAGAGGDGNGGSVFLAAGSGAGAGADGTIDFETGGATQWRVTASGDLESQVAGNYVLAAKRVSASANATENPTALQSGSLYTDEGGTNVVNLPAAAAGLVFEAIYTNGEASLQINAAAGDTIRVGPNISAAAGNVRSAGAGAEGNAIRLVAINATEWIATSLIGTWTVT